MGAKSGQYLAGKQRGFIPILIALGMGVILIALAVAIASIGSGNNNDPCAGDQQTANDTSGVSTAGIDSLPKRKSPLNAVLSLGKVTVQPSIVRIINLTKNLQTVSGFETIGDRPKSKEKYPQHSTGYAVDLMATRRATPQNNNQEHTILANWLQVNSGALDIAYMIWNRKFWNGNSEGRAVKPWSNWRPDTVPLRTGDQSPTQWHEDHIHITVNGYKPNTPHTSGNLTNITSSVASSDCAGRSSGNAGGTNGGGGNGINIQGPRVITNDSKIGFPYLNIPKYFQGSYWPGRGRQACGVTSVKMVLDYYFNNNYPGLKNRSDLGRNNVSSFYNKYVARGYQPRRAMEDHLGAIGSGWYSVAGLANANDWANVRKALNNQHPVIVFGDFSNYYYGTVATGSNVPRKTGGSIGHVVVIIGMSSTQIMIADPAHGGGRYAIPKAHANSYLNGYYHGPIYYYKNDPW